MFTINVSITADDIKASAANLVEHFKDKGYAILNMTLDEEADVAEMLFTTHSPTEVFLLIEQYAAEDIPVPESLSNIYFSETVYSIHAVPANVSAEELIRLINHNVNFGCIVRRDNYRLRNTVFQETDGDDARLSEHTIKVMQEAINVLSKKVLGTELLTLINKQEEVKWPVH